MGVMTSSRKIHHTVLLKDSCGKNTFKHSYQGLNNQDVTLQLLSLMGLQALVDMDQKMNGLMKLKNLDPH